MYVEESVKKLQGLSHRASKDTTILKNQRYFCMEGRKFCPKVSGKNKFYKSIRNQVKIGHRGR